MDTAQRVWRQSADRHPANLNGLLTGSEKRGGLAAVYKKRLLYNQRLFQSLKGEQDGA